MGVSRSSMGNAYFLALLADASLSVIATLVPTVEGLSNLLSTVVLLATIVVLVLSLVGKLEPRPIFLAVSVAYLAIGMTGLLIGFALVATLGPARAQAVASEGMSVAVLARELPWYMAVHWFLLGLIVLVAVWGNVAYRRATDE